ncbi:MAG: S8/S53 family peptidase [Acidimicrobiia bacterium]|nr:S8/S53 family peptidase [Acidimicrobiia bacterium]
MSAAAPPDRPNPPFVSGETSRVATNMGESSNEFLYRPGELVISNTDEARSALAELVGGDYEAVESELDEVGLLLVHLKADPVAIARALRAAGHEAQVNHVLLADGYTADPMRFAGIGLTADPMRFAAMLGVDPMRFANSSTARPAAKPADVPKPSGPGRATVAILDTGLDPGNRADLVPVVDTEPDPDSEQPDENGDGYLDLAAGHGTFIAGIVRRAAPTATIVVDRVIEPDGDGDDARIAMALIRLAGEANQHTVVNLSFSGYTDDDQPLLSLERAIARLQMKDAVVVAAAGNNADCRIKWPAALPDVIGVAALDACDRAIFSNYGAWVRACAPGVDVVSNFFAGFDGAFDTKPDIDEFDGWAMWSGTSFSAPRVAGAIANEMIVYGIPARAAAHRLVGHRDLFRLPHLGVVVNVV